LLLDASASMGFGRHGVSKLTYATYLCAAFGHLLGLQGDATGLLVFDETTRRTLPPRTRPGHMRDLFTALESTFPAGRTGTDQALAQIAEAADKKSLVVLFTDLLDAPATLPGRLRQVRSHGHDVVLFHLLDPEEVDLPYDDLLHFEGVEPGDERRMLADPAELRSAFRRESLAFRERWRNTCREGRIEYRFASTDRPPSEVLREFLFERQRHRFGAGGARRLTCTSWVRLCSSASWRRLCRPGSTALASVGRGLFPLRQWSFCGEPSARSPPGAACASSCCSWRAHCWPPPFPWPLPALSSG